MALASAQLQCSYRLYSLLHHLTRSSSIERREQVDEMFGGGKSVLLVSFTSRSRLVHVYLRLLYV